MPSIRLDEGFRGAVPFVVDRTSKPVTESRNGISVSKIPGRFSICDTINGNGRKYPQPVWEKNLSEGSLLKKTIAENAAWGLLEHPKDGKIDLNSNICVLITDAKLSPAVKDGRQIMEVVGELMVLNLPGFPDGQRLQSMIEIGYNPLVSSRGFGSVIKDDQGVDVVQDDYVCEGWDVVMKPSFETAQLVPNREAKETVKEAVKVESGKQTAVLKEDGKISGPPETPVSASVSAVDSKISSPPEKPVSVGVAVVDSKISPPSEKPQVQETIMDKNTIRSSINAWATRKPPTEPARFSEGLAQMGQLHQDIANYVAEDNKRGWEGQKLHDEVSRIERVWSESATAPTKQAAKLTESYKKALRVTKVLGETALSFKKQLVEAKKIATEAAALVEELTSRGQKWVQIAATRKTKLQEMEFKVQTSCEALEIMAARYHEDVTDLGRHVIQLEFREKITPEITKQLKEAKKPKDIVTIREQLDPKSKDEPKTKPAEKPVTEGKEAKPQEKVPEKPAPIKEDLDELRCLVPSVHSITESVEIAKRLSAAHTTAAR